MKRRWKKKTVLVTGNMIIKNDKGEDCLKAWNEGKKEDTWLIPISVLESTYELIE